MKKKETGLLLFSSFPKLSIFTQTFMSDYQGQWDTGIRISGTQVDVFDLSQGSDLKSLRQDSVLLSFKDQSIIFLFVATQTVNKIINRSLN